MSSHNGRASRFSDESLPFAVELPVPKGGFGTQLEVMHSWAKENDIKWSVSRNRLDAGGIFQTWCFTNEKDAAKFAAAFGGGPPLKEGGRGQRSTRGPRSDILF
jgi:hypothetical protein